MAIFYPQNAAELVSAVQNADNGDTISLQPNMTYTFDTYNNTGTSGANALPIINKRIIIEGNSATLKPSTGVTGFRLMSFGANGHIILQDLIMRDFEIHNEAGVIQTFEYNDIFIVNCQFINNRTTNWDGGVIRKDGFGILYIANSIFDGNSSEDDAGVLSLFDYQNPHPITILNCNFTNNNSGSRGGAIRTVVRTSTLIIDGCTFNGNSGYLGGAVHCISDVEATTIIRNSVFEDNRDLASDGGAIYAVSCPALIVENTRFINNSAISFGAGIFASAVWEALTIDNCEFDGNHLEDDGGETYGGALYLDGGIEILNIRNTRFNANEADYGAAIYDDGGSGWREYSVNYCEFSNNTGLSGQATSVVEAYVYEDDPNPDYSHNCWNGQRIVGDVLSTPSLANCPGPTLIDREVGAELTAPETDGASSCYGQGDDNPSTGNPISLRKGEKRLQATDLRLNTSQGELGFHRAYRQSTQAERDFMGRGWSHNHHLLLDHSTSNQIIVDMPESKLIFHQSHNVDANTVRYLGASGSTVYVDEDTSTTPSTYTMVASDESVLEFAESLGSNLFALTSRQMPNGDAWYYHYNSGQLVLVHDDPTFNGTDESSIQWALRFAYYDTLDFKDGKLWRVGIKETSNLDTSPTGVYVEFDYAEQSGVGVYLTRVRDVRNYSQCYRYGFQEGETDATLKTYLVKRIALMTAGVTDCSDSNQIVLEEISYTLDGSGDIAEIEQQRGDGAIVKELVYGTDNTIERIQGYASHQITHDFHNGLYQGATDANSNTQGERVNSAYRKAIDEDRNGNRTALKWSADGKRLEGVVDGVSAETQFLYDPQNRLLASTDATGRTTLYEYADAYREPTAIRLTNDGNLIENGNMEDNGNWLTISGNAYVTNMQRPHNQRTVRRITTNAAGKGIESVPWSMTANKTYEIWVNLHIVSGSVKVQVPGETAFDKTISSSGWAKTTTPYTPTSDASDLRVQLVSSGGAAEFYVKQVIIFEDDGSDVVRLPVYGDTLENNFWTGILGNSPTINQLATDGRYPARYVRHVIAETAGEGIESVAWDLTASKTYQIWVDLYIVTGSVKVQVPGESAFDETLYLSGWSKTATPYTPSGSATDLRVQVVANEEHSEFYVKQVILFEDDGTDIVRLPIHGDMIEDGYWTDISGNEPQANEHISQLSYGGIHSRYVEADAANLGIKNSATIALVNGKTYQVFAFVRPISGTVKMQLKGATSGVLASDSSSGTGAWEKLALNYTHAVSNENATLEFIADGAAAEFFVDAVYMLDDSIILRQQSMTYDSQRRKTDEKLLDPADGTTVLQHTTYTYDDTSTGRGLLSETTIDDMVGSNDVNIILTYDEFGRVIKRQQNSNFGDCDISFTVYDDMGNVVATICNYDPDTYADPTTAQEAADLYANVGDPDKNQVTTHVYDGLGRRIATTTDAGTSFARTTHFVLDSLGRVTLKIDSYVDENSSMVAYDDPSTWTWDAVNGYWKDGSNREIEHGTDLDENLVTETVYNLFGQVRLQRDVLGHVVLYGYDLVGNLVKTITQAATPGYNNDYTGDPDLSSYTVNTGLADADLVNTFDYDAGGNQVKATDALGRVTFTVYDGLNRPVKVVQNAKDSATVALNPGDVGYVASDDPRSAGYMPSSDPDRDQIASTEYDLLGRVIRTQRLLENRLGTGTWDVMLYGYDEQGRQVRVIQHASQPDYDIASDPALANYTASSDADVDHITETVYDIQNRVQYSVDVDGNKTWQVYDGFNRAIKQIVNASYTGTGTAPENTGYVGDLNNAAADIIAGTTYDDNGRVQKTRRVLRTNDLGTDLEYLWTLYGYDSRGRVIKVIENASNPSYDNSPTGDYDLSAYTPGSNSDEDIITTTEYDVQGRVKKTTDTRGNVTLYGYDSANRRVKTVVNASVPTYDYDSNGDTDLSSYTGSSPDADQDQMTTTVYDLAGRVIQRTDVAGRESVMVYDELGRTTLTVENYNPENASMVAYDDPSTWVWDAGNGYWEDGSGREIEHGANNDENLIAQTVYNKGGQVLATYDVKGTQTAFTYDGAGRRVQVTQAVGTMLETTSYTGFDKAGRLLRSIQNWRDTGVNPDARNLDGSWVFAPTTHGSKNDVNLIAEFEYDHASRRVKSINPVGDVVETSYAKNGQSVSVTHKAVAVNGATADVETQYRYDALRRRTLVVQAFNPEDSLATVYTDPATWDWSGTAWQDGAGTPVTIEHGTNNDENIIVKATYDKGGRLLNLRDPRGKLTQYAYDKRSRRTELEDANGTKWLTSYADVGQMARVTMNYPGLTTGAGNEYDVQRDFDRLGRLTGIDYSDAATTPRIAFAYDSAGNRAAMSEYDDLDALVRQTEYAYDAADRLIAVDFDTDGDTVVEQSVSYAYDERGLRTTMTMPGSMTVTYTYDEKGRLVSLTDWATQTAEFDYDGVNRHIKTYRPNAMLSTYEYDPAGRLQVLRHHKGFEKLAEFQYSVDARGNRVSAREFLSNAGTETIAHDAAEVTYKNTWTDTGSFHETSDWDAALAISFWGDAGVQLVVGTGSDHSIFDVYINGSLWDSFDAYAASTGERTIDVEILNDGLQQNTLEVRNRLARNVQSTGYKLRFKHLVVPKVTEIDYAYDALSRLAAADYVDGSRSYAYAYDVAGNRLQEQVTIGITTTTTDWTYDDANRIATMKVGSNPTDTFTYDRNGNLTGAGGFTYTWDKANRLTNLNTGSVNHHYAYDGDNNRLQQTVGGVATDYLLDIQPELTLVLGETKSGNTTHYLHSPRGVHAVQDPSDDWFWMAQDGLGSVRAEVDDLLDLVASRANSPYGQPFDEVGTFAGTFGFAGEQIDPTGQSYNRARYYDPTFGVFTALDPFEGVMSEPMSMNGYSYAHNNPTNWTDPSGMTIEALVSFIRSASQNPALQDFVFLQMQGWALNDPAKAIQNPFCGGASTQLGLGSDLSELSQNTINPEDPNPPAPPGIIDRLPEYIQELLRRLFRWLEQNFGYIIALLIILILILILLSTVSTGGNKKGPCGKVYPNLDRSDLNDGSMYAIYERPLIRRGLRSGVGYLYVVTLERRVILGDVFQAGRDGVILHHPDLVGGQSVAYAGHMTFYNNVVVYWDNNSGHYHPNPDQNQDESDCIKEIMEDAGWGPMPAQSWHLVT